MKSQRGGFAMGLIVGLLIGLALALAVALYVTKVPVPFVNKVPQRTAEQDAAEQEKNRNWDPNAGLASKPTGRAPAPASAPATAVPAPAAAPPVAVAPPASAARDPAAILAAREGAPVKPTPAADPFNYFVQAGAFAKPEDAEQQRARLAMMGYEAKVTEREQSGRTVYRVRIGPFPAKDAADGAKDKLAAAGVDSALVRVQK